MKLKNTTSLFQIVFLAETGTWTIVIVTPAGEACIVSHGEAWQAQPSGARRGARWSS